MHAQTRGCDLGERFAEKRAESAGLEGRQASRIERKIPILEKERRSVPDDPGRFPNFDGSELFRKALRIARGLERLPSQDRGCGVMSVRFVVVRTETGDDHVGFPFSNCPDDVGENFVTVPDPQGFRGALRKTEIDGAGEKLLAVIDAARGEKFVSSNHSKTFAEFRTD